jgi:hypothetical protein
MPSAASPDHAHPKERASDNTTSPAEILL